jgi:hypothetical protein
LALEYLEPASHRLWKADLLAGRVDLRVAAAVGDRLGLIHGLTARDPALADRFATDDLFQALRVEPYLLRVAERHHAVADAIRDVVTTTTGTHEALVHGDASPKNILVGPNGPVLLDAETAWWGDPAFDVAFCLNHLLLKCLLSGSATTALQHAAHALVDSYRTQVTWTHPDTVLGRAARLVPALMLARVDGRSPVEYLDERARGQVRAFALRALLAASADLTNLMDDWKAWLT